MCRTLYEVDWVEDMPLDELGDADLDAAVHRQRYFTTIDAARRFAKEVYPSDWFGAVAITECHFELYEPGLPGKYLVYDTDPEYYEGEE